MLHPKMDTLVHTNNPVSDLFRTFSSSYDAITATACTPSTATNTVATCSSDIVGGGGMYCIINYIPNAANKRLYGGYIKLARV